MVHFPVVEVVEVLVLVGAHLLRLLFRALRVEELLSRLEVSEVARREAPGRRALRIKISETVFLLLSREVELIGQLLHREPRSLLLSRLVLAQLVLRIIHIPRLEALVILLFLRGSLNIQIAVLIRGFVNAPQHIASASPNVIIIFVVIFLALIRNIFFWLFLALFLATLIRCEFIADAAGQ